MALEIFPPDKEEDMAKSESSEGQVERVVMRTIEVKITAQDDVLLKIERMLAWMHYNTAWGHSGVIATSIDGDGPDSIKVEGVDLQKHRDKASKPSSIRNMRVEWMGYE